MSEGEHYYQKIRKVVLQHYLNDAKSQEKITPKLREKLVVLSATDKLQPGKFRELSEAEFTSLMAMSDDMKSRIFLQTVNQFFGIELVSGPAEILGKSGLIWNTREIILDRKEALLFISRQKKQSEDRIIPLKRVSVQWLDLSQDKYSLILTVDRAESEASKKKKKKFQIGSSDQKYIRGWYEKLVELCGAVDSEKKKDEEESQKKEAESKTLRFRFASEYEDSVPVLMAGLAQSEKLTQEFLFGEDDLDLVFCDRAVRILRHHCESSFRTFCVIPGWQMEPVVQAILSLDSQLLWNQRIDCKSCVEHTFPDLHCAFIQLIVNSSILGIKCKYEFLRYLYRKNKNSTFILEKSLPKASRCLYPIPAQIEESVWAFFQFKAENKLLIVNHTKLGRTNFAVEQNFIDYLSQLSRLSQHLGAIRSGVSNMPTYFCYELIADEPQGQEHIAEHEASMQNLQQLDDNNFEIEWDNVFKEYRSNIMCFTRQKNEPRKAYLKRMLYEIESETRIWESSLHPYLMEPYEAIDRFQKQTEEGQHLILKDEWAYVPNGALKFINEIKLAQQKEVFAFILKRIGSNLLSGKSILSISLPVTVFDKRSNLERYANSLCFAYQILEKAYLEKSPIERLKKAFQLGLSIAYLFVSMNKPFNPILGETFQGRIKGCPVYAEQISHHPPVSAFLLYGKNFKVSGHLETQAVMRPNYVIGVEHGFVRADFIDGTSLFTNIPKGRITGITFGDRTLLWTDSVWMVDLQNQLVAQISFDVDRGFFSSNQSALDYGTGGIFKVDETEISRIKSETLSHYQGLPSTHRFQKLVEIHGRWTQEIFVDGEPILGLNDFPHKLEYEPDPLASDSRFRADLIAWQLDDFDLAMDKKEKLENMQRADRKLREKFGPPQMKH